MDRLASCYFCGTALDAPLAEEPVVPEDLGADRGRTVTLCPTCSRKLEAVMDDVRVAIDADSDGVDATSATESSTAVETASDREPATGSDPEVEAESTSSDPLDSSATDEESEASAAEDDLPSSEAREESSAVDDPIPDSSASATPEDEPSTTQDDATPAANHPSTAESEGEPSEEEVGEERRTISALENSKVMRMLENREFPVERDSFQAVAANAYGVGEEQVGRVVDMAIDRGLLAESDGMLIRPD